MDVILPLSHLFLPVSFSLSLSSVLVQYCLLPISKPSFCNTKRCITTIKQTNKCTLTPAQWDSCGVLSLITNVKWGLTSSWTLSGSPAHSLTSVMLLNNEFRLRLFSVRSCVNTIETHKDLMPPKFTKHHADMWGQWKGQI